MKGRNAWYRQAWVAFALFFMLAMVMLMITAPAK